MKIDAANNSWQNEGNNKQKQNRTTIQQKTNQPKKLLQK